MNVNFLDYVSGAKIQNGTFLHKKYPSERLLVRMGESFQDGGNHQMNSNDQHQQLLLYSISMYAIYILSGQWYRNYRVDYWFHITIDSDLDQVAVSTANMVGP
jgi:hypothetical protein